MYKYDKGNNHILTLENLKPTSGFVHQLVVICANKEDNLNLGRSLKGMRQVSPHEQTVDFAV